jgi:hypothetical protein
MIGSNFERINPNAAGIDIGSGEHWVCVPAERTQENVRRFGCYTPDLMELADWLLECRVDTVAIACNWSVLDSPVSNPRSQGAES